jgi:hypothetical protein
MYLYGKKLRTSNRNFRRFNKRSFNILCSDFLLALKRSRVPSSKRFIVPTIDSELHLSFGEQSGGTENHPHLFFSGPEILKLKGDPSLKNKIKSLLYTECFSLSPIKPSFKLGRSVTAMLKENIFLKYLNLSSPP